MARSNVEPMRVYRRRDMPMEVSAMPEAIAFMDQVARLERHRDELLDQNERLACDAAEARRENEFLRRKLYEEEKRRKEYMTAFLSLKSAMSTVGTSVIGALQTAQSELLRTGVDPAGDPPEDGRIAEIESGLAAIAKKLAPPPVEGDNAPAEGAAQTATKDTCGNG